MRKLKNPCEDLEAMTGNELRCRYINLFSWSRQDRSYLCELEIATHILSERSFEERREAYLEIKNFMKLNVDEEDYERASVFKEMLQHYGANIL